MAFGSNRQTDEQFAADSARNQELANAPKYYDPTSYSLLPAETRLGVKQVQKPGAASYDEMGYAVPSSTSAYEDPSGREVWDQAAYDAFMEPYRIPASTAYGGDWSSVRAMGDTIANKYNLNPKQLGDAFQRGLQVTGADLPWMAAPAGAQILLKGLGAYDSNKFGNLWNDFYKANPTYDDINTRAQHGAGEYGTAMQNQGGGDDWGMLGTIAAIIATIYSGGALAPEAAAWLSAEGGLGYFGGLAADAAELGFGGALGAFSDLPSSFEQMVYDIGIDPSSITDLPSFNGDPLSGIDFGSLPPDLDISKLLQKGGRRALMNLGKQAVRGKGLDPGKALMSGVSDVGFDVAGNTLSSLSRGISGATKMDDFDSSGWADDYELPSFIGGFSGPNMSAFQGDLGYDAGMRGADYASFNTPGADMGGGLSSLAKRLRLMDPDGGMNWGNILKGGASVASIYDKMTRDKQLMGGKGAALAADSMQPAKMFTFPGTALGPLNRARFGRGRERPFAQGGLAMACGGGLAHPYMMAEGGVPGGGEEAMLMELLSGGEPGMGDHPVGLIGGPGGGQEDNIPAQLSPGEYVFDAETVAALGDGNTEEGARRLDMMREQIRAHKRDAPVDDIPPQAMSPLAYMRGG